MYKQLLILGLWFFFQLFAGIIVAQPTEQAFAVVDQLQELQPRFHLVFLRTDWCRYCQQMERSTLVDATVVNLLNQRFYFTEFNAESNTPITFSGKIYRFRKTGIRTGVHDLALKLGMGENGQLSYPTMVIVSPTGKVVFRYSGFLDAVSLGRLLQAMP